MSAGGRSAGGSTLPRSSHVRSSRASRARLSPFLPLRTPATQAIDVWFVVSKLPNGLFFLLYEIAYVVGE